MHLLDYSAKAALDSSVSMCYRRCWRVILPVTGHNGELRVKQEARADFAAMSRDHVMEEDIETFTHVQEVAMQVRTFGKEVKHLKHHLEQKKWIYHIFPLACIAIHHQSR